MLEIYAPESINPFNCLIFHDYRCFILVLQLNDRVDQGYGTIPSVLSYLDLLLIFFGDSLFLGFGFPVYPRPIHVSLCRTLSPPMPPSLAFMALEWFLIGFERSG